MYWGLVLVLLAFIYMYMDDFRCFLSLVFVSGLLLSVLVVVFLNCLRVCCCVYVFVCLLLLFMCWSVVFVYCCILFVVFVVVPSVFC